jgi:hypothetical protein
MNRKAALSPDEATKIATDAYIYGYSLITTDVTRVQMSNVDKVEEMQAPTGTFFNIKGYPPASYRGVSATNAAVCVRSVGRGQDPPRDRARLSRHSERVQNSLLQRGRPRPDVGSGAPPGPLSSGDASRGQRLSAADHRRDRLSADEPRAGQLVLPGRGAAYTVVDVECDRLLEPPGMLKVTLYVERSS